MKKNCQLMMVGKSFNRKNYAFAVPKSVHFLPTISLSILSLQVCQLVLLFYSCIMHAVET